MTSACSATACARAVSPAPKARLSADATPPPIAPADNMPVSIANGKTSPIAASGTTPSSPM